MCSEKIFSLGRQDRRLTHLVQEVPRVKSDSCIADTVSVDNALRWDPISNQIKSKWRQKFDLVIQAAVLLKMSCFQTRTRVVSVNRFSLHESKQAQVKGETTLDIFFPFGGVISFVGVVFVGSVDTVLVTEGALGRGFLLLLLCCPKISRKARSIEFPRASSCKHEEVMCQD